MDQARVPMNTGMYPPPTPSRRRRAPAAVLALLLVVGVLAGTAQAAPAPAGTDPAQVPAPDPSALLKTLALAPTDSPASPDDPFVAVVVADKDVHAKAVARITAQVQSSNAAAQSAVAGQAKDAALAKALVALKVKLAATHKLSVERKRMAQLTVRAYVTGGDAADEQYKALLAGDTSDAAGGQAVLFNQVLMRQRQVTDRARRDLAAARRALTAAQAALAQATETAEAMAAEARDAAGTLASAVAAHQAAVAEAAQARTRLQAAASRPVTLVPLGSPLVGLPRLTADDLALWFATTSYRPRVATPIADYARWFIEEGQAEGIRGDIAFAQAVLETGGFSNDDSVTANNFSGIGHCDSCGSGWAFPSPEAGVRAQIQLLKSYAVRKPDYARPLVDKRLRGPAGCCPTWGDLTTVWATDPGYGPKVMLIYTSMVEFALHRRAAGQGLEDTAVAATEPTAGGGSGQ